MDGKGIRVVLADDHALYRSELRAELEAAGFVVCADVADGPAAVAAVAAHAPDACILDVSMPGGDGVAAAGAIHDAGGAPAIVMLSTVFDELAAAAAFAAGASAYLLKDVAGARLGDVLQRVVAGEFLGIPAGR